MHRFIGKLLLSQLIVVDENELTNTWGIIRCFCIKVLSLFFQGKRYPFFQVALAWKVAQVDYDLIKDPLAVWVSAIKATESHRLALEPLKFFNDLARTQICEPMDFQSNAKDLPQIIRNLWQGKIIQLTLQQTIVRLVCEFKNNSLWLFNKILFEHKPERSDRAWLSNLKLCIFACQLFEGLWNNNAQSRPINVIQEGSPDFKDHSGISLDPCRWRAPE